MSGAKQFAAKGLIDEISRSKALIKYEIKQLEMRLQRTMGGGKKARLKTQEAARYCSALARLYEDWLRLISRAPSEENLVLAQPENNVSRSYLKIQTFKQLLASAPNLHDELQLVLALKNYYNYLQNQMTVIQPQPFSFIQGSLVEKLKVLARATNPSDWLFAVIHFANELGENTCIPFTFFTELNDKDLLSLAEHFGQEEFVLLINSIFLYQFEPQLLFRQLTHPEKLVSVKSRLSMLYHFIEIIHQAVMQSLRQRGLNGGHDYLFHGGEELPPGVKLEAENSVSGLIISALKEWRLHKLVYPDEQAHKNKINDLFRAYKFWFNPNRLIDTLMTLERELIGEEATENCKKLIQYLRGFYHQLTTTECLELYGYFANKDSIYLMRTLAAAMSGQEIPSLPPLNDSEQKIIARVYYNLDCAMEAIRDELLSRHITTTPYIRNDSCKPIRPGHRNLNAIIRILELYGTEQMARNQVIEQLFNKLEA